MQNCVVINFLYFSVIFRASCRIWPTILKISTILFEVVPIPILNGKVSKVKDRYKLGLKMPETRKLFGITKFIEKARNGENVPSFKVVVAILIQRNLSDNQHK